MIAVSCSTNFRLNLCVLTVMVVFRAVAQDEFPSSVPVSNVILITNTDGAKRLQSPNFPNPYPKTSRKYYWISGSGSPIRIQSKSFSLAPEKPNSETKDCDIDRLTVWDAKYPYFAIGKFCGTAQIDLLSYSDSMVVLFDASADGTPGDGFDLEISRSPCGKADFTCPSKNSVCISSDRICDGVKDCVEGEDEICSMDCGKSMGQIDSSVRTNDNRIIGGTPVKGQSWPWQVKLSIGGAVCGGAIVAPQWIATAAHCCLNGNSVIQPAQVRVILKPESCGLSSMGEPVQAVIPHPEYKSHRANQNDYCLLILTRPLAFSNDVKPICLPRANDIAQIHENCFTAGCGSVTQYNADASITRRPEYPDKLLQVPLNIVGKSECSSAVEISPETVCAYSEGKDTCQGDSGGPLICKRQDTSNAQWVLHGVTSYGFGCADKYPGVYARARSMLPFIARTVHNNAKVGWLTNTTVDKVQIMPRYDEDVPVPVIRLAGDADRLALARSTRGCLYQVSTVTHGSADAAEFNRLLSLTGLMPADLSKISDADLKPGFDAYGKFGDKNFSGNNMALKNADKWLKESEVFGKKITTTDTSITFKKVVGNSEKTMTFDKFKQFLGLLAETSNKEDPTGELQKIVGKLKSRSSPGTTNTTAVSDAGAVDRLTDTSKYTGSHKERFDAEGKGKGIEGREEVAKNDGYVGGYKGAGTFEKPK